MQEIDVCGGLKNEVVLGGWGEIGFFGVDLKGGIEVEVGRGHTADTLILQKLDISWIIGPGVKRMTTTAVCGIWSSA